MAFKVTSNHWEIIINFMEQNLDLARGRIKGPSGKEKLKKLWSDLALQLNSAGLGDRSVQKWQKTWTDFKYMLKKKATDVKADLYGTGGGSAKTGELNELEIRTLNILGKTFHDGLGRLENGCSFLNKKVIDIDVTPLQQSNMCETSQTLNSETPKAVIPDRSTTLPVSVSGKREHEDHNYIRKPSKVQTKRVRPADSDMVTIYNETLNELRDINTSLKEISHSSQAVETAINKLTDAIINSGSKNLFSLL